MPLRSDDNRTRKKTKFARPCKSVQKPVLKAVLHAQRRQPQQLNGSVSESFGSLTSLPAPPRARRGRGAANHAQNNMDASMSYTGNYEAVSLVKRPLLLATTAAHQRLAEDSVVHQSIRRLEICGDGLRLRSTRGLFYLICAIRDAYRSKKDTSGDDTPASPPAGPAALASCPQRASGRTRPSLPGGST